MRCPPVTRMLLYTDPDKNETCVPMKLHENDDNFVCYSLDPNSIHSICARVAVWKRQGRDLVLGGGCDIDGN